MPREIQPAPPGSSHNAKRRRRLRMVPWIALLLAGIICQRVASRHMQQLAQERLNQSMIRAIKDGNEQRAITLLDMGADVNSVERAERRLNTVSDLVQLLRGQSRDETGPSALELAEGSEELVLAERLVKQGAT